MKVPSPDYLKAFGLLSVCGFLCYGIWTAADFLRAQKGAATNLAAVERQAVLDWLDTRVLPLVRETTQRADQRTIEALGIVRKLESDANGLLDRAEKDANAQIGSAIAESRATLAETTQAINTAARSIERASESVGPLVTETKLAVSDLRPGFQNLSLIAMDTRQAIRPNLECKGNGSCWPSEVTGIAGSTKTLLGEAALTARYWRKETPQLAANIRETTGNVSKLTRKRWYVEVAKVAGPVLVGVIAGRKSK